MLNHFVCAYELQPGPAEVRDMREHPGLAESLIQSQDKYGSGSELCGLPGQNLQQVWVKNKNVHTQLCHS